MIIFKMTQFRRFAGRCPAVVAHRHLATKETGVLRTCIISHQLLA